MQAELEHLAAALEQPKRPLAAVVGGANISTKLDLLGNLIRKVEVLVVGGGMANTFLNALGVAVGASLCEHDMAETARDIVAAAKEAGCTTSFDLIATNPDTIDIVKPLMPHIDYFMPSIEEARDLSGLHDPEDNARFFLDHGVGCCALTMGEASEGR